MTSQSNPTIAEPSGPPLAVVTGASLGLGLALTLELARQGWHVIVDARDGSRLREAFARSGTAVTTVPGDVTDPGHRADLVEAVRRRGGLDLLVSNASVLGPSPQPLLAQYPLDALQRVFAVNTFAPLALWQALLPFLRRRGGVVVQVSSDAAVEAYPGWGGYGSP
jgi:NAD(P)-dependent dehydrogenase (short-subunit alcohol dehydrogenase family)